MIFILETKVTIFNYGLPEDANKLKSTACSISTVAI